MGIINAVSENFLSTIVIFLITVIIIVLSFILAKRFYKILFLRKLHVATNDDENKFAMIEEIKQDYNEVKLYKLSQTIEKYSEKHNNDIIKQIGMDDIWIKYLMDKKLIIDFNRVLKHAFVKGLFKCFIVSLTMPKYIDILFSWIKKSSDMFFVKKIALSYDEEEFDDKSAYLYLKNSIPEIREMTGDYQSKVRFFAYKILLNDSEEKSIKALWDGLKDSDYKIRDLIINKFITGDKNRFYNELLNLVLNDPVYIVRKSAWDKIHSSLEEFYKINNLNFNDEQLIHILQLLRYGNKEDESVAFKYCDSANFEIRYHAAKYLDNNGSLERLCLISDRGDLEMFNRNFNILKKASQVNIVSFISCVEKTDNPAGLEICARILTENGDRIFITKIAQKVFKQNDISQNNELYELILECINLRGDDQSLSLLKEELIKRKNNEDAAALIYKYIPVKADEFFKELLMDILKNIKYNNYSSLRNALLKMPSSFIISQMVEILISEKDKYLINVKIEALKILAELNAPYCIQIILENLLILSLNEAKEYAKILVNYPLEIFIQKAKYLLNTNDAKIRYVLIASLPVTGIKEFLPLIKNALKDSDPDVRIAAVWALTGYSDIKSYKNALSLLRDPVEKVRMEVANSIGEYGTEEIINELKNYLIDQNESDSVKAAIIAGLGKSKIMNSINILTNYIDQETDEELQNQSINSLSLKYEKSEVLKLIDIYKNASQKLKKHISDAFKKMSVKVEPILIEMLNENNKTLKPFVVDILDASGYVEETIRKLSYKDPSVRRKSAEILSLIGTKTAYKGIVLAARDPDEEVRIKVIKALEILETIDGKEILEALKSDPDLRVKKYTLWAMERLESKAL